MLLALLMFLFFQSIANSQYILNRRTFQRRSARYLDISSAIGFRCLPIPFGDV